MMQDEHIVAKGLDPILILYSILTYTSSYRQEDILHAGCRVTATETLFILLGPELHPIRDKLRTYIAHVDDLT